MLSLRGGYGDAGSQTPVREEHLDGERAHVPCRSVTIPIARNMFCAFYASAEIMVMQSRRRRYGAVSGWWKSTSALLKCTAWLGSASQSILLSALPPIKSLRCGYSFRSSQPLSTPQNQYCQTAHRQSSCRGAYISSDQTCCQLAPFNSSKATLTDLLPTC